MTRRQSVGITMPLLEQSTVLQIVFNDDVRDSVHDKLDVARVRGTSEVRVDVFRCTVPVQLFKFCSDVCTGLVIRITT